MSYLALESGCGHPAKMSGPKSGLHKSDIFISLDGVDQTIVEQAFKPWLIARIYPTFVQKKNPDILIRVSEKENITSWPLIQGRPVIIKVKDLELLTHLIGHALGIPHVDHDNCLMSYIPGTIFTTVDLNEIVSRYSYR